MRRTKSTRRPVRRSYKRRTVKNRRRFKLRRLLWPYIMLAIISGTAYGCYELLTTPKLNVSNVKVNGTKLLEAGKIELDARPVVIGKNILLISKNQITERVKKNRPEISEVRIGRVLPKTVAVKIKERVPHIAVMASNMPDEKPQACGYLLVDKEGYIFHKTNKLPQPLPIIKLDSGHYSKLAFGVKTKNAALISAMKCLDDCHKINCDTDKISVDQAGNLCLNIGSDFYVKLGQPVEIPEKLETLQKMLPALRERGETLLYVDVSCRQKPVWKRKPEPVVSTENLETSSE